jgi:hypothetical protein
MKVNYAFNVFAALTTALTWLGIDNNSARGAARGPTRFIGPTSSQTLALSADGWLLDAAIADNNSMTVFARKNGNSCDRPPAGRPDFQFLMKNSGENL